MEPEAWPSPQSPNRDPLPRVEDLPIAEQGYEPESVKAAFDSFYRHAAQLDAALRTLEAVDSFHRQAAALRGDLRALRAAGWTQQSWGPTSSYGYGYGVRSTREGIPPAVWRIAGEVVFLVATAVAVGVAKLSWWVILIAMAGAFAVVCAIEWLAGREPSTYAHPAEPAPAHPVVEAQRAEDTEEHESLGWTAFEEAQEPSDAMTIIADAPREPVAEEEPEPAEPEPEPELPPAAEEKDGQPADARRWWRRAKEDDEAESAPDLPHHVRVLPSPDPEATADPWEHGFDEPEAPEVDMPGEPDEETEEPAASVSQEEDEVLEPSRRRFRRR